MDGLLLGKIYALVTHIQNSLTKGSAYVAVVDKKKIDEIVPELASYIVSQSQMVIQGQCKECYRVDGSHHSSCSKYRKRK